MYIAKAELPSHLFCSKPGSGSAPESWNFQSLSNKVNLVHNFLIWGLRVSKYISLFILPKPDHLLFYSSTLLKHCIYNGTRDVRETERGRGRC